MAVKEDKITVEENIQGVLNEKGKVYKYIVTIDLGRKEVYDEKKKKLAKKQFKTSKTFYSILDARLYRDITKKELQENKRKNKNTIKGDITFDDAIDRFLDYILANVNNSVSYKKIRSIHIRKLRKYFGTEKLLKDIDVMTIETFYNQLYKDGLSKTYISAINTTVKEFYKFVAINAATFKCDDIFKVAGTNAKINAKKSDFEAIVLNTDELNNYVECAVKNGEIDYLYLIVLGATGSLRRSELAGMRWKDIDFDKKIIHIVNARIQMGSKEIQKLPKRDKERNLPMHKPIYDTIIAYKEWQEKILKRKVKDDELVYQNKNNLINGYNPYLDKIDKFWKGERVKLNKYCKKNNKEELKELRLHDLRHTFVSLSLLGGRDKDGNYVSGVSQFQQSIVSGHSLPKELQNQSTKTYLQDVGEYQELINFFEKIIHIDIKKEWEEFKKNNIENELVKERDLRRARKAKQEQKRKPEDMEFIPFKLNF